MPRCTTADADSGCSPSTSTRSAGCNARSVVPATFDGAAARGRAISGPRVRPIMDKTIVVTASVGGVQVPDDGWAGPARRIRDGERAERRPGQLFPARSARPAATGCRSRSWKARGGRSRGSISGVLRPMIETVGDRLPRIVLEVTKAVMVEAVPQTGVYFHEIWRTGANTGPDGFGVGCSSLPNSANRPAASSSNTSKSPDRCRHTAPRCSRSPGAGTCGATGRGRRDDRPQ